MKIAILAWGSLIWDPRELTISGSFQPGGPSVPLEFSRVSRNGRLTLVIDENHGSMCPTQYALSKRTNLEQAIENLRVREGALLRGIGWVRAVDGEAAPSAIERHARTTKRILDWTKEAGCEAAVWTALASNFVEKTDYRAYTVEDAIAYLRSLTAEKRALAEEYIRKAPPEVKTPFRHAFDSLAER